MADPAVTFVDGGETAQAYVVGLSGGSLPQPPAGPHRMLDMRAANGTRYRCYIPEQQGEQQGGDADSSRESSSSRSSVSQVGPGAARGLPSSEANTHFGVCAKAGVW